MRRAIVLLDLNRRGRHVSILHRPSTLAGAILGSMMLCGSAPLGSPISDEAAVAELKKAGSVTKVEHGFLTEVAFPKGTDPEPLLQLIRSLPRLRAVQLSGTQIDDAGLAAVGSMAQLEYVGLRGTAIGDAGVM